MKRIEFVFFDAGGGHRSAATALQQVIGDLGKGWDVSLFNLQEALDEFDFVRGLTGVRIQDVYNKMLKSGATLGSAHVLRVLQVVVRRYHRTTVRKLERVWKERAPDMLVSFIPHFNRALRESFHKAFPGRPFVTILTDLADYPPHFWMEKQPQFFICGTDFAVAQARALGHSSDRIFHPSGMILHPRFYDSDVFERPAERKLLGLSPDLPTGLVLFGGHGSREIERIAERLDESSLKVQLILICGRNEKLTAELRRRPWRIPVHVEGFTTRVPHYMRVSDFFIGKPGPGSISEALAAGLPVIVSSNAWTLPQERYNTQWVLEKQVGIVLRSFRKIESAVAEMLEPATLARFRSNALRMPNRAVFEIPDFLEEIFRRSESSPQEKRPESIGARLTR